VFNNAIKEHQDPHINGSDDSNPETIAFKVAWVAVEKVYYKVEGGRWQSK
jgi:cation transport regulator